MLVIITEAKSTEAKSKRKQNQRASCHRKCATCTSWYLPSTHFRPNARLLNHCPLDPYKIEDIYDAALYTLRSQPHAPSIPTQHNVVSIDTPLLAFRCIPIFSCTAASSFDIFANAGVPFISQSHSCCSWASACWSAMCALRFLSAQQFFDMNANASISPTHEPGVTCVEMGRSYPVQCYCTCT